MPRLTAYTPPSLDIAQSRWTRSDGGWRDVLCARIGAAVSSVSCADQRLEVRLNDGAVVTISLRNEDYVGPEAFEFVVPGQDLIVS